MTSVLTKHPRDSYSNIWTADPHTDLGNFSGRAYPSKMHLSLNSGCNLSCTHCYRSRQESGGTPMSREMLDHIIADFFPHITAIRLGGSDLGEQMMAPLFPYFLEQVSKFPIDVELVTNATGFTEKNAELAVKAIRHIDISMEGIGDGYQRVRGFSWPRFEQNLDLLLQAKARHMSSKPTIQFLVTTLRSHEPQYFELIDYAKNKNIDMMAFRNFYPIDRNDVKESYLHHPEEHNRFFQQLERYAKSAGVEACFPAPFPTPGTQAAKPSRRPCAQPFEVFGIQADGEIIPCCVKPTPLGYYRPGKENVLKSWNSPEYIRLRETVNSNKPLEACRKCEVVSNSSSLTRPEVPVDFQRETRAQKGMRLLMAGDMNGLFRGVANMVRNRQSKK